MAEEKAESNIKKAVEKSNEAKKEAEKSLTDLSIEVSKKSKEIILNIQSRMTLELFFYSIFDKLWIQNVNSSVTKGGVDTDIQMLVQFATKMSAASMKGIFGITKITIEGMSKETDPIKLLLLPASIGTLTVAVTGAIGLSNAIIIEAVTSIISNFIVKKTKLVALLNPGMPVPTTMLDARKNFFKIFS